jgi:hypothetical protein
MPYRTLYSSHNATYHITVIDNITETRKSGIPEPETTLYRLYCDLCIANLGPPRSSQESFSAWVESLDKILKDLQTHDGNRGTWGSKLWIPFGGLGGPIKRASVVV